MVLKIVGEGLVATALNRGLTGNLGEDAIYIHPSTMESTHTCLGDCVLIVLDDGRQITVRGIGTAWPSSRIKRTECSFSESILGRAGIAIGMSVCLVRLTTALSSVISVHVRPTAMISDFNEKHAIPLIEQAMENKAVCAGWRICFPYNGSIRQVEVDRVLLNDLPIANENMDVISSRVAAVTLSDDHDQRNIESERGGRGRATRDNRNSPSHKEGLLAQVENWLHCAVIGRFTPQSIVNVSMEPSSRPDLSQIRINEKPTGPDSASKSKLERKIGYGDIGGLKVQLAAIREMINLPLTQPWVFTQFGLPLPKGVLLYGLPGTGKTMIARAVANESGAHVEVINGTDILSKFYGESEARLREIFKRATENAPSILFIDEIDALCPKRDDSVSDNDNRIVATLLTLMDGISSKPTNMRFTPARTETYGNGHTSGRANEDEQKHTRHPHVVVIGATNRPNAIDPALRRPGRFDRELEVPVPTADDRFAILRSMLVRVPHSLTEQQIQLFAKDAHGYVGADLAMLCKEAAVHALNSRLRLVDGAVVHGNVGVNDTSLDSLSVGFGDMTYARLKVRPSALREVSVEIPRVLWTDIGGQEDVKQRLREAVSWPLLHPEAFIRMAIRPPKGILLYGPPGTSKTMMAKALATESGLNFIAVKGPELFSKWVGDSEKAVREVFRRARATAPCIVFFDEIDSISSHRGGDSGAGGGASVSDRVLTQLLNELDGVVALKNVVVVAATNRPDAIDSALLRPGRIDRILHVTLPDKASRAEIFRINMRNIPQTLTESELAELVLQTDGFSGAEVASACREAAMLAMRCDPINASTVSYQHFLQAAQTITPRTSADQIEYYESYANRSGLLNV